jgi:hAT family C-terminal dimerisation region
MPLLAHLAWEIFTIPAMSALSECVFSAGGHIVMENRTPLITDRAEELIFCKQNYFQGPML